MTNKDQAQKLKAHGNDAYKKKDFASAVNNFKAAIELDPTEITYYTNLAAVHFETKVSYLISCYHHPISFNC
jgi:stress-induced-phosphoprotein 1